MTKIEDKTWKPDLEQELFRKWVQEGIYDFDEMQQVNDDLFIIDTPPPYPSGRPWHIGAASHYAQIDMIARTARMLGKNVFFPIGIDRNGLPVEIYTEKKHKIRMRNTDRERFLQLCKSSLDELENEMIQIMKKMGLSSSFSNYYRTDSDEFRKLTQATFIDLWHRGLVYSANRPNNYCYDCGTTISDAEITYDELSTLLVFIKFKLVGSESAVTIATTRPELLFTCQMIIVHPDDDRYESLINKKVVLPLFNREVLIIPHHSVKREFGTGAVMVCSYGDQNDVQIFRELHLNEIVGIDLNGKITQTGGPYAGLKILQARKSIIEDLKKFGYVVKEKIIMHRTPLCERSRTPIEIIPMKDYYIKQLEFVPKIKELSKKLSFHPETHRQILDNWLESISIDWPISRRRFYGTEIPIWYCTKCEEPNVPPAGKYYKPWKEDPPFSNCLNCGHPDFIGDERTFDTWMDSSITPLYITKFKQNDNFFSNAYPTCIRPQSKDIVRTWLFYTMLRCYQLTKVLPWSDVWVMGYGVDEKGEKMSKSKGNVIDPLPLVTKYGADTFRFWSAIEARLGQDFRCSEQKIAEAQKFLTKLWNVGRFVSMFDNVEFPDEPAPSDKWILGELYQLIDQCKKGYQEYDFYIPANAIREFTRNLFAAHYIELVKSRAYGTNDNRARNSAINTLHYCFSTILTLLSPICPFITEQLWTKIYSTKSIHNERMPKFQNRYVDMRKFTALIIEFNSSVWASKKDTVSMKTGKSLSLRDQTDIKIPIELEQFSYDLKHMHNLT